MSSLLPFLLLFLTMHTCKARYLGVIVNESHKQVQFSVKEVEKERLVKTSIASQVMIPNSSAELQTVQIEAGNGESIISEGKGYPSTQNPKDSRVRHKKVKKKRKGKVTAVSQVESLVSVSWHIDHNKQKGNPGFNSDYAPPKTHPPSHN
ncbi:root meristem growth factor 10-like [Macadamia integrifolia]|uniref:root meristem growth factor 10-like n=1 Tax=Macadamia integrifolia TaxID=60698 RepID=UPI001C4E987C|nr:root meristem growth factor 10-like [Macadamia integrifolia]